MWVLPDLGPEAFRVGSLGVRSMAQVLESQRYRPLALITKVLKPLRTVLDSVLPLKETQSETIQLVLLDK